MVVSALESAGAGESYGLPHNRIILSAKVSVQDLIDVYRMMAAAGDYPLHVGLTEAGMGAKGIVATTAALAILMQEGIGDTIRASLTPTPNGDRTEEVIVSQQILQSMGIRSFTPQVTACPGCGRTTSTFFQELAEQIQTYLRIRCRSGKTATPGSRRFWRQDAAAGEHVLELEGVDSGLGFEVVVGHHERDLGLLRDFFHAVFPSGEFGTFIEIVVAVGGLVGLEPLVVVAPMQPDISDR